MPAQDFRRTHMTVAPGDEVIGFSLWDRQTYVSTTTTKLTYFTAVRGAIRDGNLTIASQLPAREAFLIQAIRVYPIVRPFTSIAPTTNTEAVTLGVVDDLMQLYNDGVLQFSILSKNYGQFPIFMLLPGAGPYTNNATLTTTAQASNVVSVAGWGNPDNRAVYSLAVPITIPEQTGFSVTMEWAAALTLKRGNTDMQIVLDGKKIRPKQ